MYRHEMTVPSIRISKRVLFFLAGMLSVSAVLLFYLGFLRTDGIIIGLWAAGDISTTAMSTGLSALGLSIAVIGIIRATGQVTLELMGTSLIEALLERAILAIMGPWGVIILFGILGAAA